MAYWTALPASIVGIRVSPAARPKPRRAEEHTHFPEAGRTTIATFCSVVSPKAADVIDVSDSIVLKVLSMARTIVGKISRLSTREAVSHENPDPPSPFLIKGTRRKTEAKPYTTVGMAVMILSIHERSLAAGLGPKPWIKQQHPTAKVHPMTKDESERSPLAQIMGMMPNFSASGFHREPKSEGPPFSRPSKAHRAIKTKMADMRDET